MMTAANAEIQKSGWKRGCEVCAMDMKHFGVALCSEGHKDTCAGVVGSSCLVLL